MSIILIDGDQDLSKDGSIGIEVVDHDLQNSE